MLEKNQRDIPPIVSAIYKYIFDHWLEDGSRLPPCTELAAQFGCDEESLIKALRAAEIKRRVSHSEGIWSVTSPETPHDTSFSFTRSAHGRALKTEVIDAAIRFPTDDKEHAFYLLEQRVHDALRLAKDLPFIVIERLRLLDGHPGAFQQVYLNPTHFPADFIQRHDFKTESLIKIYEGYGYRLLSRDTRLAARSANLYEINWIRRYGPDLGNRTVLDAEQRLYAEGQKEKSPIVLEFLKASYLENWNYEIKSRPATGLP